MVTDLKPVVERLVVQRLKAFVQMVTDALRASLWLAVPVFRPPPGELAGGPFPAGRAVWVARASRSAGAGSKFPRGDAD